MCFEQENKRSRSVAARFGSSQAHGRWPWHGREGCCGWSGPGRGVERALRARPLRATYHGWFEFRKCLLGEASVSKSGSKHRSRNKSEALAKNIKLPDLFLLLFDAPVFNFDNCPTSCRRFCATSTCKNLHDLPH